MTEVKQAGPCKLPSLRDSPVVQTYKSVDDYVEVAPISPSISGLQPGLQFVQKGSTLAVPSMLTRQRRGRAVRSKRLKGRRKRVTPKLPPIIDTVVTVGHRLRFQANATASATNVTVGTLIGACGGIGTVTNSQLSAWASTIKVRRITLWPGTPGNNPSTCEVIWSSAGTTQFKDESKNVVMPTGITVERPVVSTPPKDSLAAFWQSSNNASSILFQLTCSAGTVVDVDVAYTLGNNNASINITGFAVIVVGTIYYGRLDGVGGKFPPQGVPTTN